MQVRHVPLRHELGQTIPPSSAEISSDWSVHASNWWPSGNTLAAKNGGKLAGDAKTEVFEAEVSEAEVGTLMFEF